VFLCRMRGGCGRGNCSDGAGRQQLTTREKCVHEPNSLPGFAMHITRAGLQKSQREAATACCRKGLVTRSRPIVVAGP